MKFDLAFERTFPHPIEAVWRALTDRRALGTWLMETDFEPEQGRSFRMWCATEGGGTDTYLCSVVALEAPHRMVWSWVLDGRQDEGETLVEFRLQEAEDGTRLTIRHSGDRDALTIERFRGGWPVKLDQLGETLLSASG